MQSDRPWHPNVFNLVLITVASLHLAERHVFDNDFAAGFPKRKWQTTVSRDRCCDRGAAHGGCLRAASFIGAVNAFGT